MAKNAMWLLVSGEYSDYMVHGAYTNEEDAQRVARFLGAGYDVEEVPLNDYLHLVKQGAHEYQLWRLSDGWHVSPPHPFSRNEDRLGKVRATNTPTGRIYEVHVLADTEEEALKAGTEYVRQYIAMAGVERP